MLSRIVKAISRARANGGDSGEGQPLTSELVDFLVGQMSAPANAVSLMTRVEQFRALSAAEQERELPGLYLLLEHYLVELDPYKPFKRAQLREMVQTRYEALTALPQFALIFDPASRQELLLCRLLVREVLGRACKVLGAAGENVLGSALEWVVDAPNLTTLPAPFGLDDDLPAEDSGWVALLQKIAREAYGRLATTLGEKSAGRLFESSYEELASAYIGLDAFPVVINLLPEALLDEQKIRLLSRAQVQRVLSDKVQQLQEANEQLRRAQETLQESEERYALAVRGANDGLWDWNFKNGSCYFSPRWKSMLGFEETEIGESPDEWLDRVHPEDLSRLNADVSAHLHGYTPHFESEHRMLHKDGRYRWMLSRGLAVQDASGKVTRIAGSQTDITRRKIAERQLLHDAFHDELTALPNRALFTDHLERAARRAKRQKEYLFAVLFLDVDRFKLINDGLGHLVGDQLLVAMAGRLQSCLRPGDLVARLGGDEFVLLAEDLKEPQDATAIAERIHQELAAPFHLDGAEVFTSASIGIAMSTGERERPEDLLRDADTAMYRAKAQGTARHVVFQTGMRIRAMARLRLETDLRKALERQEFTLHYQPIVNGDDSEIAGAEALLRWRHPERGMIPPAEFIPIAEETGLIEPIGEWVLRSACAQNAAWQAAGFPPIRVSVNISGRQFARPKLIETVARVLEETRLDPRYLELELTESVVLRDAQGAFNTLSQLSAMGIAISIDDFGTGYSSLRYLLRFPITTLKIDRSFIQRVIEDGESAAITKTIVTLAHNLRLAVVAEGVETSEQARFLSAQGCDRMQGFVFGRPMPAEAFSRQWEGETLRPGMVAPEELSPVGLT